MALYNFQKRFVPKILTGEKAHTIRAKRSRQTKPGEMLHLYTGLRQRGAQLLMRARCTKVEEIVIRGGFVGAITTRPLSISIDGVTLSLDESEQLARSDGFAQLLDMVMFWRGRTPFRGDIVHWKFPPEEWGSTPHKHAQEMGSWQDSAKSRVAKRSSRGAIDSARRNAAEPITTTSARLCVKPSGQGKSHVRPAE